VLRRHDQSELMGDEVTGGSRTIRAPDKIATVRIPGANPLFSQVFFEGTNFRSAGRVELGRGAFAKIGVVWGLYRGIDAAPLVVGGGRNWP